MCFIKLIKSIESLNNSWMKKETYLKLQNLPSYFIVKKKFHSFRYLFLTFACLENNTILACVSPIRKNSKRKLISRTHRLFMVPRFLSIWNPCFRHFINNLTPNIT